MRIAVVGAGGVGGGFGAALAKAGADVTFLARGAHLAAMKSTGLKVGGGRGDTHLVPTQATDDPAEIGKVDIVLFCVKLWDVESAGAHIKPLIGANTAVIPLQNGIDAPERLVADPWARRRDGRRGADLGLDRVARRDPSGRHLHAHDLRRARRQAQPARRGFSRAVPEGRFRRDVERTDPDRSLDEVHPARQQCRHDGAVAPADRQAARRSRHAADLPGGLSGNHRCRPRQRHRAAGRRAASGFSN